MMLDFTFITFILNNNQVDFFTFVKQKWPSDLEHHVCLSHGRHIAILCYLTHIHTDIFYLQGAHLPAWNRTSHFSLH